VVEEAWSPTRAWNLGHYGWPAAALAGAAVLALVVHLAVPYAHIDYADPDVENEVLTRGEAADAHDDGDSVAGSSPALTLTGTIILGVTALGLAGLGYAPLATKSARWLGWGLSFLAVLGALMAFSSSMYWVGSGLGQFPFGVVTIPNFAAPFMQQMGADADITFAAGGLTGGFTGLLERMTADNAGDVFVISPVIVALATGAAIVFATMVCTRVVATRDGLRERATAHAKTTYWALGFLAAVLLVPWSIGSLPDYEGEGDEDFFFFGAHTVQNAAKLTDGAGDDEEAFGALAYAIGVMVIAGWVGVLLGSFATIGGVMASENVEPALARTTHYLAFGSLFMAAYATIVYVLAWIYMWRPGEGEQFDDFQPGYFPILAAPILAMWGWGLVGIVRQALARRTATPGGDTPKPVSFE
jgi:hypothetical protein